MKIYPIFAWYDLWIGLFIDTKKKRLYIFPIPCFGLVIEWGPKDTEEQYPERQAAFLEAADYAEGLLMCTGDEIAKGLRILAKSPPPDLDH